MIALFYIVQTNFSDFILKQSESLGQHDDQTGFKLCAVISQNIHDNNMEPE